MYTATPRRKVIARARATASAAAAVAAGLMLPLAGTGNAAPPPVVAPSAKVPSSVKTISSGWTIPWGATWLPDGSALINERDSVEVYKVSQTGTKTKVAAQPLIASPNSGETLLGIAVSPNWLQDHYIYLYHGAKEGNRIARMTYDGSTLTGYKTLVSGIKRGLHNGGRIKFGPDGFLYATTGDAGIPGESQDKQSLNGKILRLTTDGKPAPGNPFGTLVYSYGHRNPEGLTWDAQGRLWETEIGEDTWDELNLVEPGKNYGWPTCEGECTTAGMSNPARQWHPAQGVPGGLTYTDGALYIAALKGQRLWRVPVDGTTTGTPVAYFTNGYGRLRDVVKVPGKSALWITTDKAGRAADRVLQVDLT
ncbi:PQQ-dependent sugar dehydrogenase [Streptomyces sp. NPDC005408]|uniref:PQQ-dependent sugar dehydrogenase n=1 Tax=Streptomyces sp. NPDC005408 TaxID=3155341 RepID=UPI0033AF0582